MKKNAGKISTIFIANLSEISLNLVSFMKKDEVEAEISEDHDLCDRFIFSVPDNSLLITPHLLNKQFFTDSVNLLSLKNVSNRSPRGVGTSICEAILKDKIFFRGLSKTIKENPKVALLSYAATPEFFALVSKLRKLKLSFITPEAPTEQNKWTFDFFGSKCGFRQEAMSLGRNFPALPKGVVCANKEEVLGWSGYFLENAAGCVLKTNRGLAGAGLQIIRKEEAGKDKRDHVESFLKSEDYWQSFPLVVEEFIPPDLNMCGGAPNIELMLKDGKVTSLYVCSMRISKEGVFQGIEFGKESVPKALTKKLEKAGRTYGKLLKRYSYQGFFELDFVMGRKGNLVPIESNLRRTGGTHAYELAKRLLGNNFSKNFYLTTNNRVPIPNLRRFSYQELVDRLQPVLFPINGNKEGVIITIVRGITQGRLGYVIVNADKKRTLSLEHRFIKLLNG